MEYKDNEEKQKDSNVDELLYLKQQKNIVERARHLIEKSEQLIQLQREVLILSNEKWIKMDNSVESMQEDIDSYVKEYIIPIQERQQELDRLENSLIEFPEKKSIVGRVGKFFERFIPGITKEGRERRKIADKKQTIEGEIETYKLMIERNPFKIFGANKDIKSQLLEKIDVTKLDKYSTMQNDTKNYLKPDNSVKSIANRIKREDMVRLLNSHPALKEESNYLISELINNGMEAFNSRVVQMVQDCNQNKKELITKIDFEKQEDGEKDILDRITQQIQSLTDNLTPDELEELKRRDLKDKIENEIEDNQL